MPNTRGKQLEPSTGEYLCAIVTIMQFASSSSQLSINRECSFEREYRDWYLLFSCMFSLSSLSLALSLSGDYWVCKIVAICCLQSVSHLLSSNVRSLFCGQCRKQGRREREREGHRLFQVLVRPGRVRWWRSHNIYIDIDISTLCLSLCPIASVRMYLFCLSYRVSAHESVLWRACYLRRYSASRWHHASIYSSFSFHSSIYSSCFHESLSLSLSLSRIGEWAWCFAL